jgi:glutathione S-transferase
VTLQLFGHSFSAYTRKALIALDEKGRAYDTRMLEPERSDNSAELARRGPIAKFPLLANSARHIVGSKSHCLPRPSALPTSR